MALKRITDAATEPVTLAEAKLHIRPTSGSTEDALITSLIKTARMLAENETKRSFIEQTWQKTLDGFPCAIELPYPPVTSVDSIVYIDVNGANQTLAPASYIADLLNEPGWVVPAFGYVWPITRSVINAVTVQFKAGYGTTAALVPEPIKQWILLTAAHFYENRESSVPGVSITPLPFIAGLLDPYRIVTLG